MATETVEAPLIRECYANLECRLDGYVGRYGLFVWEVVQAHVATSPKYPETLHYRGGGIFAVAGPLVDFSSQFRPEML